MRDWIKELVLAEQEMEAEGMVDLSFSQDSQKNLELESIQFLRDLKTAFTQACIEFNQLKGSQQAVGTIKLYGVSKTMADFMLFRNSHKLIFSLIQPGVIQVSSSQMPSVYVPGQDTQFFGGIQHILKAQWGPFEELRWTYNDAEIQIDHMVRYYLKLFVRNSLK